MKIGDHVEFSGEYIIDEGFKPEWVIDSRKKIGIIIEIEEDRVIYILCENKIFSLKNSYVFDLKVLQIGE